MKSAANYHWLWWTLGSTQTLPCPFPGLFSKAVLSQKLEAQRSKRTDFGSWVGRAATGGAESFPESLRVTQDV